MLVLKTTNLLDIRAFNNVEHKSSQQKVIMVKYMPWQFEEEHDGTFLVFHTVIFLLLFPLAQLITTEQYCFSSKVML